MDKTQIMNGERFMDALSQKLKNGNLISHRAKEAVASAIKKLKSDLSICKDNLTRAEENCKKTQNTAEETAKIAATAGKEAAERIKLIELDAQTKEKKLNDTLKELGLSEVKQVELEKQVGRLNQTRDGLNTQLKIELEEVKGQLSALHMAKAANEAEMSDVFNGALSAITTALDTINVNELLTQSGGFQSSSSGVTDFKKYRTSSRSYNIKELRKKKKESRKKEKERKKGSRKKERRSKKRRKD